MDRKEDEDVQLLKSSSNQKLRFNEQLEPMGNVDPVVISLIKDKNKPSTSINTPRALDLER